MSRSRLGVLLCAVLAAIVTVAAAPVRIVAIGDVHGAGDAFVSILQRAGLIDAGRKWTGGTAVLVQTGDLLDRGQGARAVLDLLIALEPQASAAGGRVQSLLGNHEVMNLLGETRDVAPDLFQQFAGNESDTRREQAYQAASKLSGDKPIDKNEWLAAHPAGYIEYREAFAPGGTYGKWLRSKPIIAEINGTVFMHGGINSRVHDRLAGQHQQAGSPGAERVRRGLPLAAAARSGAAVLHAEGGRPRRCTAS